MRRVYAYLMRQRHISREVITEFVHEKLLYEDIHHNCVFVGVDADGVAKHAHLRNTNSEGRAFRMNVEGGESAHSFHKDGTDKSLYVFGAPIDLVSHMTLYPYGWLEHSYVACCGTSLQPVRERLRQNPKIDMVYLCLDNDEAGCAMREITIPSTVSNPAPWATDSTERHAGSQTWRSATPMLIFPLKLPSDANQ